MIHLILNILGGCALVLAVAILIRRRLHAMQPTGTHRAVAVPVSPYPDSEPGAFRYCPEELRQTYHALHATGGRRCWTCGTETKAGQ